MSYNAKVYRAAGAASLVVTSSGTLDVDGTQNLSGTLGTSGASAEVNIESGGTLNIKSGGTFTLASGGAFNIPVQTAATTATTITNNGLTVVTGTTVGPTFAIAAPEAGCVKFLSLTATSSGATHRAIIAGTTDVIYQGIAGDTGNQLTLASSATVGVTMVGASATAWHIVGTMQGADAGRGAQST